ncbi:MAG: hypothetical protein ACOY82_05935 [Pseudomonadota bacterium]
MTMRIGRVLGLAVTLACAASGSTMDISQVEMSPKPVVAHSVRSHPHFRCVFKLLERVVEDAGVHAPQRLYVGPLEQSDSGALVRVYWPQDNAILLVDWPASCGEEDLRIDDAALGWYRTKARIDLDTDVVPTPEDIGGSAYLVDRTWVDRVIADCRAGELLVISSPARD